MGGVGHRSRRRRQEEVHWTAEGMELEREGFWASSRPLVLSSAGASAYTHGLGSGAPWPGASLLERLRFRCGYRYTAVTFWSRDGVFSCSLRPVTVASRSRASRSSPFSPYVTVSKSLLQRDLLKRMGASEWSTHKEARIRRIAYGAWYMFLWVAGERPW